MNIGEGGVKAVRQDVERHGYRLCGYFDTQHEAQATPLSVIRPWDGVVYCLRGSLTISFPASGGVAQRRINGGERTCRQTKALFNGFQVEISSALISFQHFKYLGSVISSHHSENEFFSDVSMHVQ